jgi:hypothetical protein
MLPRAGPEAPVRPGVERPGDAKDPAALQRSDDGFVNFPLHLVMESRDALRMSLIGGEVPGARAGTEEE